MELDKSQQILLSILGLIICAMVFFAIGWAMKPVEKFETIVYDEKIG